MEGPGPPHGGITLRGNYGRGTVMCETLGYSCARHRHPFIKDRNPHVQVHVRRYAILESGTSLRSRVPVLRMRDGSAARICTHSGGHTNKHQPLVHTALRVLGRCAVVQVIESVARPPSFREGPQMGIVVPTGRVSMLKIASKPSSLVRLLQILRARITYIMSVTLLMTPQTESPRRRAFARTMLLRDMLPSMAVALSSES